MHKSVVFSFSQKDLLLKHRQASEPDPRCLYSTTWRCFCFARTLSKGRASLATASLCHRFCCACHSGKQPASPYDDPSYKTSQQRHHRITCRRPCCCS